MTAKRALDVLMDVDDGFARFFRALGYDVTWDYDDRGQWYEIMDADGLVCQVDHGVDLDSFLKDLPALMQGARGTSAATYQCRCPESCMERFRELGRRALKG